MRIQTYLLIAKCDDHSFRGNIAFSRSRPISPRLNLDAGNLGELYDKIAAVAEKEETERRKEEDAEEAAEEEHIKPPEQEAPANTHVNKMVLKAAKAFKKKRNMREVAKTARKKTARAGTRGKSGKRKKGSGMASLVEQVNLNNYCSVLCTLSVRLGTFRSCT